MSFWEATFLAIVEGITEFVPVSSTGHMILASKFMRVEQTEFVKMYEVAIQLGAILSIVSMYWRKLTTDTFIWIRIITAFLPTAFLGFMMYDFVKSLFDYRVVSVMLMLWGVIFILVEKFRRSSYKRMEQLTLRDALIIGLFQSLAMVPGTSRSGATIVGGLVLGMRRVDALEFSFLLAVPTMFSATLYDIYRNMHHLHGENLYMLLWGGFVAFVCAWISVRWLLKFVSTHTLIPFGIYRIILSILVFLVV